MPLVPPEKNHPNRPPSKNPSPHLKAHRPGRFDHVEITAEKYKPPPFEPTTEQRQLVTVLKAVSIADDAIALKLGISRPTLCKHFRHELDHGKDIIVSQVAVNVIKKALKGDNQMIMFYLRTHGPDIWKDRARLEHTGADGAPLTPPMLIVSFLEDEQPTMQVDAVTLDHDERASENAA